jgi:hypothetical protein
VAYFSGWRSLDLGVFGEPLQGAPGCWGFWARGPRFLSVSGARESDRLLLAGWEVSRFGQGLVSASGWARQQGKDNQISGN